MTQLGSGLRAVAKSVATRVLPPRYRLQLSVRSELRRGEPELQLLPRLLEPHRAFIDVGANMGVYAAVAERYTRHVFVVEPHPLLAERLRNSLRSTTRVLQLALSETAGHAVLWSPEQLSRCSLEQSANGGVPVTPIEVPTSRLDDLQIADVGLVKIDVEGHELAVLHGGEATIARDHPSIIIEIEEQHQRGDPITIFDYLLSRDYEGYFFHRGRLRRINEYDFSTYQDPAIVKTPSQAHRHPDYINNFIFIHKESRAQLERIVT